MGNDNRHNGLRQEEIEGAPPVVTGAEFHQQRLTETVTVNRHLYQQTRQLEQLLLQQGELLGLFETLLVSLPRHFGFRVAELWLHDPEDALDEIIVGGERYGSYLQLHRDGFDMQELYPVDPVFQCIDATDSRMFEILKSERGIDQALLLPLMHKTHLFGSLHIGMQENALPTGEEESTLLEHLAAMVSLALVQGIERQQMQHLAMLDPLTRIGNLRSFLHEMIREVSRARREDGPFTVLMLEVDEYDELHESYGEVRGHFVLKKVAERISSRLRATDTLARLSRSRFAVLLPGANESLGEDIAERMRVDIEDFAIDDGHGAVLQVTLSIGLATWEPQQFPAVDMAQLARQMESVSTRALADASAQGGNCTAVSRLATLLV
ncbi:GGDEF domain-containing protein [Mangrovimicrobium sediminis]|uniref:diguanylate cyclase n=1 Tax=Mangrovimicrobium sediminis TaxID=2562682 RepID=A0A4Z0M2X0_9GAMM|nr:GGDEF domain-containing protein [Haliea sp. SAOS-164]TGD74033.1 GGDEF domain-containing protein [Haliea sp. SAOS-164]